MVRAPGTLFYDTRLRPPPKKIVCMNTCVTNTIFKKCFVTPPLSKGTQGQARDHQSIMTWLIFDLFFLFPRHAEAVPSVLFVCDSQVKWPLCNIVQGLETLK